MLMSPASVASKSGCDNEGGFSGFEPPVQDDTTFVTDVGEGLDTGCTYGTDNSGHSLVIAIAITRVVGDVTSLRSKDLISDSVTIELPTYDINFAEGERDSLYFNDHAVPGPYLQGESCKWIKNTFKVPIEWVNFPSVHQGDLPPIPALNYIRIAIDTANPCRCIWCTAIDWVSIRFSVVPPVVLVHGWPALRDIWGGTWTTELTSRGIPFDKDLPLKFDPSIASGAAEVRRRVQRDLTRWGVRKVTLVGHSKGGIDARHYAETANDVDRVIQIGAPNGGTKLALYSGPKAWKFNRKGIILAAYSPLIRVLGSYIPELTLSAMTDYNARHNHKNPSVKYTALAGEYDTDCGCRDEVFLDITGRPGDGVVTKASAKALPFAFTAIDRHTVDPDRDAFHTELNKALTVFNDLENAVTSLRASPRLETATELMEGMSDVGIVAQGGMGSHIVQVDDSTETYFAVAYSSGNIDLRLISPSNQVFDATSIVGNPDVTRDEGDFLFDGKMELFRFTRPEVGAWTVEVLGTSVTEPYGSTPYSLSTFLRNPAATLALSVDSSQVVASSPVKIFAQLHRGGNAVTGAAVSADVIRPDSTITLVTLRDTGVAPDSAANDGVYSGQYNTSYAGVYLALVAATRATGTSGAVNGGDLYREASIAVTAVAPQPSFEGMFDDYGMDTNENSTYDKLIIDVSLNIVEAGRYRVSGSLTDSEGHTLTAASEADLEPGHQNIEIGFEGAALFDGHVNGPYTISDLYLARVTGDDRELAEWYPGTFATAAYPYTAFENTHRTLYITGSFAYVDSLSGAVKSLRSAQVVVYDTKDRCFGCDSTALDSLISTQLKDDGSTSFVVGPILNRDRNDDLGPLDVVVRVYYQTDFGYGNNLGFGWFVTMLDSTGSRWYSDFPLQMNAISDTLKLGELRPNDYAHRSALHIINNLDETAWEAAYQSNDPITGVNVVWSPGYSKAPGQNGTYYDGTQGVLYVDGRQDTTSYSPDELDDSVVLRGFAHHVASLIAVLANTNAVPGRCPSTSADSLAWNEAFGLFYAGYIQAVRNESALYVDRGCDPSGVTNQWSLNLETGCIAAGCNPSCRNALGVTDPVSVAGLLWDLYDSANDNQNGDVYADALSNPSIIGLFGGSAPRLRKAQDLYDYYNTILYPRAQSVQKNWIARQVFFEHGIGSGISDVEATPPNVPAVLSLFPNRPNPFNPSTRISFGVPGTTPMVVRVAIYDVQGRHVRTVASGSYAPGIYEIPWDGRNQAGDGAAAGVYFCRLEAGGRQRTTKIVLAR